MMRKLLIDVVPGLIGGLVGGLVGSLLVYWIRNQGFYAIMLPGAFAGFLCGQLSRARSNVRGVFCAIEALVAGLLAEWLIFYQPAEKSFETFADFLGKFNQQPKITPILIAVGTLIGFWWGRDEGIMASRFRGRPTGESPPR